MLLGKYNILGFHTSLSNRIWNRTDNKYQFLAFFETGKIPAIQLIVDASTSAVIQLLDENDEVIVGSPIFMTVEAATGYKRLIYLGSTLAGQEDGYYSLKITNGSDIYYSEMFSWVSSSYISDHSDELMKISVDVGDFDMRGYDAMYLANMTGMVYECYLNVEEDDDSFEINEDAENNDGVDEVTYGSRAIINSFIIWGHRDIWVFLTALRELSANGTVDITWMGETFRIMDIDIEEEVLVKRLLFKITMKFKVSGETISVNNNIS